MTAEIIRLPIIRRIGVDRAFKEQALREAVAYLRSRNKAPERTRPILIPLEKLIFDENCRLPKTGLGQ